MIEIIMIPKLILAANQILIANIVTAGIMGYY